MLKPLELNLEEIEDAFDNETTEEIWFSVRYEYYKHLGRLGPLGTFHLINDAAAKDIENAY